MKKARLSETTVVGDRYKKSLGDNASGSTPWLENNEELQTQIKENKWMRWDGVEGTASEHLEWMHKQAVSLTSEERRNEFRPYGKRNGCSYYIHDELTSKANGYGFFKIEATLCLEPRDMVARSMDMEGLATIDKTVVMMKILKQYHLDEEKESNNEASSSSSVVFPVCAAVYWCNDPGFPFHYRDGVDITGYTEEADNSGTIWQVSVSAKGKNFVSMPGGAISATDCYWAYKLEPTTKKIITTDNNEAVEVPVTKVTLICQTVLNGYIPIFLSNYYLCSVLIDYLSTTEKDVEKKKNSGEHQELLKQINLL